MVAIEFETAAPTNAAWALGVVTFWPVLDNGVFDS